MVKEEITETIADLNKARENLTRIKYEYQTNPDLLNFYLPSAEFLVNQLEAHLKYLFENATGINLENDNNNSVDVWVRLEGKQFKGKGPIGIVGSYLQKLNQANRQAVTLIGETKTKFSHIRKMLNSIASFDLVATEPGSLKLGLKKAEVNEILNYEQLDLFYQGDKEIDPLDKMNELQQINDLSLEGLKLLAKTVASVEHEEIYEELKQNYDEKEVKKLIHYAKEILPSSRSPIDFISIEGIDIGLTAKDIRADKFTRKLLIEREKGLIQDSIFINGNGWIRAVDMDNYTGFIRPLHFNDTNIEQIECKFSNKDFTPGDIATFIDKFANISGFLVFNKYNQPLRLEIDDILIEDKHDLDE